MSCFSEVIATSLESIPKPHQDRLPLDSKIERDTDATVQHHKRNTSRSVSGNIRHLKRAFQLIVTELSGCKEKGLKMSAVQMPFRVRYTWMLR